MNYQFTILSLLMLFALSACKKDKVSLNYESINLNTSVNLRAVHFINENEGYIGGGDKWETGLVWETQDGGGTWELDSLDGQAVHAIKAYEQKPILGSTSCRFFWQENENWVYAQAGIPDLGWKPLFDIAQTDDNTIFAISGEGYYWGSILKSVDKGQTWSYFMTEHQLFDLQMLNEQIGYAAGFGAVYKTANAGETWELLDFKGDIFKGIQFLTPEIGFVVGDEGGIWRTTNGGESFTELKQQNKIWRKRLHWNSLQFLNEQEGWVIGENGNVWRTTNGGNHWEIIDNLPNCNYRSVYLFNYNNAILVGEDGCVVFVR